MRIQPSLLLTFLCLSIAVNAQTTAFTYQGRLSDNNAAANALYDMQFRLFDALTDGAQQGSTVTNPTVQVTNGIFTVQLDFGSAVFGAGADRYLEVAVRPAGNTGAYTILLPRHRFTSAPYAIRSADSGLLGGQPPSSFATTAELQAQNAALQARITQLQTELATVVSGTLWSKRFGSTGNDQGHRAAVDSAGNVYITGHFSGTVDFGGGGLTSAGLEEIFVAKYSGTTGAHLWSKRFGSTGNDAGLAIATDSSSDVFVSGYFQGTADFGGGALTSAGSLDAFLIKLSGGSGAHIWSKRFGGTFNDQPYGLAAAANGNVVITGRFSGSADYGSGILTSAGSTDVFAAAYSGATGSHVWSKRFGGSGSDQAEAAATDGSGNVYLIGYFDSISIDFGGGPLMRAGAAGPDIFLVKLLAADGSHQWSRRFGGGLSDIGHGVAVDAGGNAFVTGYFGGPTIDFGGGVLANSSSSSEIFIAKFNSVGSHQWSKGFGGSGEDIGNGIALDGGGNPVITGYFNGSTYLGGESMNSAGGYDIFAAKYSGANGSHLWSRRFGGTFDDFGFGLAADSSSEIFLTGGFDSTALDFGSGPLTSAGLRDVFLAKLKK